MGLRLKLNALFIPQKSMSLSNEIQSSVWINSTEYIDDKLHVLANKPQGNLATMVGFYVPNPAGIAGVGADNAQERSPKRRGMILLRRTDGGGNSSRRKMGNNVRN